MKKQLPFLLSLALLGAGAMLVRPLLQASDPTDSEKVNQLLTDARSQAYQISTDATTLESYTRTTANWESHRTAIETMKEHINDAGKTVAKLEDARANATPWQAIAIDRIKPLLKEIAWNTESVITYLNKNPRNLVKADYKDYIVATSEVSRKLAGLVADFVDYGHTKNKLERLAAKLELPAGTY